MTALSVWQPFRDLTSLTEQVDKTFRSFLPLTDSLEQSLLTASAVIPRADIYEEDDRVMIELDVAGMSEDDLDISLEGNNLSVTGERKPSSHSRYQRRERSYGSFTRTFTLPATVDPASIQARCEHGVLYIAMAKKMEARARKIPIGEQVSGSMVKRISASTA
ncbi:Hsp20/alpha crystallin family protein [Terriglobus albidus]|uniref:Hsp20/alpha crystallin family protein n=1 Tax=Terriglobus albidus TaxID=1592106 RepID=UPI0021DFBD4C|nr:Hsp20/alpha crystallin family protein [Terriglobus albidus]